ncbi:MAG: putative transport system ATP-binding protein [Pseudonocardiales bacterium]|jgi:ABC-type lipoprotein export system ATPase subunit|nr:putative transport system ATP-binding protein [Pseudonocardiales bacterium]
MMPRSSVESSSAARSPLTAQVVAHCVDVGRTYGTGERAVVALYGTTCTIEAGDRVAITGPSGSGKSTLLHLLSGLETPTVGTIEWPALGGNPRDGAQRAGLVFQAPSLIPSLSVLENVELPLLFGGAARDDARTRALEALALLSLDGLQNDLPQELSGGQAQRVVIARVLAARPQLILADEPTSKLDRGNAEHVAQVLLDVSEEIDAALVVATHDPAIARRLDHIWPMRDGRLLTKDGDAA